MAKKKLLNETQVRRFMGLAGIKPLKEMYEKKEEEKMEEAMYSEDELAADDEGPELDDGDDMGDATDLPDAADDMGDMDDMGGDETVDLEAERVQEVGDNLMDALDMLKDLGYEGGPSADMPADDLGGPEMDTDMPDVDDPAADLEKMDDMDDEDEEVMDDKGVTEALHGVNLELSQSEVVNEVARRVAKRILKAKRANKQMQEALGNRKTSRRRTKK